MEPTKYFKVKVSIELAVFSDVSNQKGRLLEHRMFFAADYLTKEINQTWMINDTSSYERSMLYSAIVHKLLYKFSDASSGLLFNFWLIVRQAEEYDFFYIKNQLKSNLVYYIMNDQHTVSGPIYLHEHDDTNYIRKLLEQGKLYVPTRKQLFEEYQKQKSA